MKAGRKIWIGFLAVLLMVFMMPVGNVSAEPRVQQVDVHVNATKVVKPFNHALFSVTGYAQMFKSGSTLAKESTNRLNFSGTEARLEVIMADAFPEKGVFKPQNMFRFVDNTNNSYFKRIKSLGMDPVLLLGGNVPWLEKNGSPSDPPSDPQAWADSAVKILQYLNGTGKNYHLNVKYVEVWNEPNLNMFWKGTWDQYFNLFNTVAKAIHKNCPGVMVEGPVLSPATKPTAFGKAFIDHSGKNMDVFDYHSYGDTVAKISSDIDMWDAYIQQHTDKKPKLMVTESDNWFNGWPKVQYMLQRQFALLKHADTMVGFHQFSLLAYQEGNYVFGLVNQDGSVIEGTYWPYWLFRNATGDIVQSSVTLKPGPAKNTFSPSYVATRTPDGKSVNLVYYAHSTGNQAQDRTKFSFTLPKTDKPRIYTVSQVGEKNKGVIASGIIPGNARTFNYRLNVSTDDGIAISIKEVTGNETPWLQTQISKQSVTVGDSFLANVKLLNSTAQPISGSLAMKNLPPKWKATVVSGKENIQNLAPGQTAQVKYKVEADGPAKGAVPLYGQGNFSSAGKSMSVNSIPQDVKVLKPLSITNIPDFSYIAPGETRNFSVKVKNISPADLQGTVQLNVPQGFSVSGPQTLNLAANGAGVFTFGVTAPSGLANGDTHFTADVSYKGSDYTAQIPIHIQQYDPVRPSTVINVKHFYNTDGFSFSTNTKDGNLDGAGNTLPADTFLSNQLVRYMGVQFQTPGVSNGQKNIITMNGQTIPVADNGDSELALLTLGTNGGQSGQITLTYNDGTKETRLLQVNDWCQAAKFGGQKVIQFSDRNTPTGPAAPSCGIFYVSLPIDAGKTLSSITLPSNKNLHIVAMSLAK